MLATVSEWRPKDRLAGISSLLHYLGARDQAEEGRYSSECLCLVSGQPDSCLHRHLVMLPGSSVPW